MRRLFDPEGAFWSKVDRSEGENNCWIWMRAIDGNGYGAVKVWGRKINAHRYSYELQYGNIPKGMYVCHRCNNRLCVNPKHLYLGTAKDNFNDMVKAGNNRNGTNTVKFYGDRNGSAVLTEVEVLEIRRLHEVEGWSYNRLRKHFGVGKTTIKKILDRKTWKHI